MRENEATLGRLQQQGVGIPSEERERERERERWSLLRAARDEADRSLSLAASLADKEAALSHAHATIKEVSPFFLSSSFLLFSFLSFFLEPVTCPPTCALLRAMGSRVDEFNLFYRVVCSSVLQREKKNGDSLESAVTFFSRVYAMTVA